MSSPATDYVRHIMELAVRPEGMTPSEIAGRIGDATTTCKRIAAAGFGSWVRLGLRSSRMWVTPEQHAAWLLSKQRKPPAVKDPKRIAAALKGKQPKTGPAFTLTKPTGAQWDRNGPARITSETKVTIWQPRTREEWIADAHPA